MIIREQQLISTTARSVAGGGDAVRAVDHAFGPVRSVGDKPVIEFFTRATPTNSHPNGTVWWHMSEGSRLDIVVSRVANSDGSIDLFSAAF